MSPMLEAFAQVSRESGVPWREFYHVTDANGSHLAELNRRAYALMAAKAGVLTLPAFAQPDAEIPRGKLAEAPALRDLYDRLALRGRATVADLADDTTTHKSTVAARVARLRDAGVFVEVARRPRQGKSAAVYAIGSQPFERALHSVHGRRGGGGDRRSLAFLASRAESRKESHV